MIRYAWSFDRDEDFHGDFDSVGETIEDARKSVLREPEYTHVYIGEIVPYEPRICGWILEQLVESMRQDALDEFDDAAVNWLEGVMPEEEKALSDMLTDAFLRWAKRFKHMPGFSHIGDVRRHSMRTGMVE